LYFSKKIPKFGRNPAPIHFPLFNMRLPLTLPFLFVFAQVFAQTSLPSWFEPKGFGGGGYLYSPSISPHDPNHQFVVCDMGGVYRSQDGGQTWTMYGYQDLVSTVKGKIQFTSDPNTLYAVRRDMDNASDPWWRGELAKSTDGGQSWNQVPDPTSSGVHRIEVDPNSPGRILLNEYNALFFSENGGTTWTEVFRPAEDQMWLGGAFWDGPNIYIGTNKGLLVSSNGGQAFALETNAGLPPGTGIYHLAGAKSGAATRLFCIPAPASVLLAWNEPLNIKGSLEGLYRMDYAPNGPWSNSRGNIPASQEIAWVDLAKNNTQAIWAASNEPDDSPQMYRSNDGGLTWTNNFLFSGNQNIKTGWAGSGGAFWLQNTGPALGFDVSDDNPDYALRTHGHTELTSNGGAVWCSNYVLENYLNPVNQPTPINAYYKSSGLDVTTAHHLLWLNQNEVFACNTDVGLTYSPDAGNTWTFARNIFESYGPVKWRNWYRLLQRPDNNHLYAAVSDINDMYMSGRIADDEIAGIGEVVRSTDNGQTWTTLQAFNAPVVWVELDKNNPDRLFASVANFPNGGIFRSENAGATWSQLPNPPRTQGRPYNIVSLNDGGLVVTYSARRLPGSDTLSQRSGVFYSTDGGNTWLDRTGSAMTYFTKDLVVDPLDPSQNTWYATVWGRYTTFGQNSPNNQGNGGVYKTTDRGQTWTRIFAHELSESITLHPTMPGRAYVTVENGGLYFTENIGAVSPTFAVVDAYPWWRPKRVFFNPYNLCEVWATSMGGGVWKGIEPAQGGNPILVVPSNYCQASGTALTASGGVEYLWNNGRTGETIYVHPYDTTTYSVLITAASGCLLEPPPVTLPPLDHGPAMLTAASATFTDGSGTGDYLDRSDCRWLIEPPGAAAVTVSFLQFDTELDYDFVRIYDGNSTTAPLLGLFSGNSLPPQVTSTGGRMLVQFESDETITASGWEITYTSTGCAADLAVAGAPIPESLHRAGQTLSSGGTVGAGTNVRFEAGATVTLMPGFEVQLGGFFSAETGVGCP
jgi:photosystem II stability/assembly factor-like uncharacterized protein